MPFRLQSKPVGSSHKKNDIKGLFEEDIRKSYDFTKVGFINM